MLSNIRVISKYNNRTVGAIRSVIRSWLVLVRRRKLLGNSSGCHRVVANTVRVGSAGAVPDTSVGIVVAISVAAEVARLDLDKAN